MAMRDPEKALPNDDKKVSCFGGCGGKGKGLTYTGCEKRLPIFCWPFSSQVGLSLQDQS